MIKTWTEEEISFLKENYHNKTNEWLATKLNISCSSIMHKAYRLKLHKSDYKKTSRWTEEDIKFLVDNYPNESNEYLSKIFDKSPKAILNKANNLNLKKSQSHISVISKANGEISKVNNKVTVDKISEIKKGKYACNICNNGFDTHKGLSIHINKKHDYNIEKYYREYINKPSKCIYCNNEARFINFTIGYGNLCKKDECISKSRAYNTSEWHEINESDVYEDYLYNKTKTLIETNKKLVNANPNFHKEKSHNSVEYWLKRGYTAVESVKNSSEVIEHMQSVSHKNRIENPEDYAHCYNTKIEHYLNKDMTKSEADNALRERQTTFSKEICIEKYGMEDGTRIWKERQERWMETMDSKSDEEKRIINFKKIKNCSFISNISQELFDRVYKIIENKYKKIYYHGLNKEFHLYNYELKKHYLYDFVISDIKKCIEFNGWFWHCKPGLYESDYFNKVKSMYAHEIWENDRAKNGRIEKEGYDILIIWEDDYKKDKEATVEKCIEFLLNDKLN